MLYLLIESNHLGSERLSKQFKRFFLLPPRYSLLHRLTRPDSEPAISQKTNGLIEPLPRVACGKQLD